MRYNGRKEQLQAALTAGGVAETSSVAKRMIRSGEGKALAILLKALSDSPHTATKNAAAVALSDLGADQAVPILIDLIRDPRYRDRRGTFVYALWPLNWQKRFSTEVASLVSDPASNYEVRQMAVKAFEQGAHLLTAAQKRLVTQAFSQKLYRESQADPEVRRAIARVLITLAELELAPVKSQRRRQSA